MNLTQLVTTTILMILVGGCNSSSERGAKTEMPIDWNTALLSYEFTPGNESDGYETVDSCSLTGEFADISIVEIEAIGSLKEPDCEDFKFGLDVTEYQVKKVADIAGVSPDRFTLTGIHSIGPSILRDGVVGDTFLVSIRKRGADFVSFWPVSVEALDREVAVANSDEFVDLPSDLSTLKQEVADKNSNPSSCSFRTPILNMIESDFVRLVADEETVCSTDQGKVEPGK